MFGNIYKKNLTNLDTSVLFGLLRIANHYYILFQVRKMKNYYVIFVGRKHEVVILGLNVNEGCYYINVVYTKLIHLKTKQCEHEFYINHDKRNLMELLYPLHLLLKIDMKRSKVGGWCDLKLWRLLDPP